MKKLVLLEPHKFVYDEVEFEDSLQNDEVLLKIHKIGICGTDYHAYRGRQPFFSYPRVLGHELGAEIIKIGKNVNSSAFPVGSKCSVEPYINCGECSACKKNKTNCCEKLQVLGVHTDGGMCQYLKVPSSKIHISAQLNYEQLALVETLAIGCHAVNRANIEKNDKVLIIGAGPIGLSLIEFVKLKNVQFAVLDLNEHRLEFCRKNYDANTKTSLEITDKFSVIFDATGNANSMNNSINHLENGGKIIFVGLHQGNIEIKDTEFHRKETTLLSSRNALPSDFKFIIEQIELGKINTDVWISHRIAFDDVAEKFEYLLKPETSVIKTIISL